MRILLLILSFGCLSACFPSNVDSDKLPRSVDGQSCDFHFGVQFYLKEFTKATELQERWALAKSVEGKFSTAIDENKNILSNLEFVPIQCIESIAGEPDTTFESTLIPEDTLEEMSVSYGQSIEYLRDFKSYDYLIACVDGVIEIKGIYCYLLNFEIYKDRVVDITMVSYPNDYFLKENPLLKEKIEKLTYPKLN